MEKFMLDGFEFEILGGFGFDRPIGNKYIVLYSGDAQTAGYYSTMTIFNLMEELFVILVDDEFTKASVPAQKCLLYHEIGHVETGSFDTIYGNDMQKYISDRIAAVENGKVMQIEIDADFYMYNNCSTAEIKAVIEYFKELINYESKALDRVRHKLSEESIRQEEAALKEFELRTEYLIGLITSVK